MPYVNIKVTREGTAPGASASATTPEQKAALIQGVSDLLFEVMGKPRHMTFVVIDEVELENSAVGGLPTAEFRRRQSGTPGQGGTSVAQFVPSRHAAAVQDGREPGVISPGSSTPSA